MKKYALLLIGVGLFSACADLELNPLSKGSVTTFYSNQEELELAANALYKIAYFPLDNEEFTDNMWSRTALGNAITFGTLASDNGTVLSYWTNAYKGIAMANSFMLNKDKARTNTPEQVMTVLEAEIRTIRALQYSNLITHFGDVPFLTGEESLTESYLLPRKSNEEILDFIFTELDWAADKLPEENSGVQRLTKGAALGIKARTALYMGKWEEAKQAASAIMNLADAGIYELQGEYGDLFSNVSGTSREVIISLPRSEALGISVGSLQPYIPNLSGGWGSLNPTWDLMVSYECTDGKAVDKSPLYNPAKPFENRDPRLKETIVEFGSEWLGYKYEPHPDTLQVLSNTGTTVPNRNSRGVNINSSWNGLVWKKSIDDSWLDMIHDNDYVYMRLAEILLTYAEAKIELNDVDGSVLDALNSVRARAYGVDVADVDGYPSVSTTAIDELKTIIKRERRVEFAMEGLRYMDLIRWRIAEFALTRPVYGMLDPDVIDRSKWFFAGVPSIDEDGVPDWSSLTNDIKRIADRNFDKSRQYLWPIPAAERIVNESLPQNPNY